MLASLHAASYNASVAQCAHGHTGGIVAFTASDPRVFQRQLGKRGRPEDRFRHTWMDLNAISMWSIHAETLAEAFHHEETLRIEADCVVKRDTPRPVSVYATAFVFQGTYAALSCTLEVAIASPWATSSHATISGTLSALSLLTDANATARTEGCTGADAKLLKLDGHVTLDGPKQGVLIVRAGEGLARSVRATYVADPMSNLKDGLLFDVDAHIEDALRFDKAATGYDTGPRTVHRPQ